jgi:glycosyltransferase involved in cell wall biosynthesis
MRVLMTADAVGGVWTYALELMRGLPAVDFILATMGARPSDAQRAELPRNARLFMSDWKLEWQEDPWEDVRLSGQWLLELEAAEKADVVHLNGFVHGQTPFRAPKIVVAHSCILSWWRAVTGKPAPASWNRYRHEVERGLQEATIVAAPTASMLATLAQNYHFTTPSTVIYNGRSFTPRLAPERKAIFAAGRMWDEAKNLATVLAAAPRLDWPVRIAGEGGAGASDVANVRHLGILDRDGMAAAYGASAIYLFPALYEPFGLSILEAALCGCALILGDIASLRELWRDCAIFVPPRDVDAIVAATNRLIAEDGLRAQLARCASDQAERFTVKKMASEYKALYRSTQKEGRA